MCGGVGGSVFEMSWICDPTGIILFPIFVDFWVDRGSSQDRPSGCRSLTAVGVLLPPTAEVEERRSSGQGA